MVPFTLEKDVREKIVTFSRSERFSFPHPFPLVTCGLCTNLPACRNRTLDLCTTSKRLCMSLYVFAAHRAVSS